MKTLKRIFTIILFVTTLQLAQAQHNIVLENSTLWKVEHTDLEKPSYIFGTMHMMCPSDFKLSEKLVKAMNEVDALVLEINMSDPDEIKAMQTSMAATKKISEELDTEQYQKLDTLVRQVMGMPVANLDAYGLSMLNMIMMTKMLPCKEIKSYEAELMQMAQTKLMPIYSLETVAEQIEIVKKSYPTDFALEQIMLYDAYKKDFEASIISYKREALMETVANLTKPEYMDENATLHMQVLRNKNWVQQMPEMMEEGSNLFAVGAAHLTDEFGLIHLLREKGYTVSPVLN